MGGPDSLLTAQSISQSAVAAGIGTLLVVSGE